MSWIDGTGWRHERALEMARLLAASYTDMTAIDHALAAIGAESVRRAGATRIEPLWYEILKDLHGMQRMRKILAHACSEHDVLDRRIEELSDDPPVGYGNPEDRYQVLLAGPTGTIPFVNRTQLRKTLRAFVDKRHPVLIIDGAEQSGKSHSYELISHVFLGCTEPAILKVDFLDTIDGDTAEDLMDIMRTRLALRPDPRNNIRTGSAVDHAHKMVNSFVGDYNNNQDPRFRRIIVIDGAGRSDIGDDVLVLVNGLIKNCAEGQLVGCQLVIIGFRGDLSGNTRHKVTVETTSSLGAADVREYFHALAAELGGPIDPNTLDQLVKNVMARGPDLALMSEEIRTAALRMVDG